MIRIGIDAGNSGLKVASPDATGAPQVMQNELGESCTPSVVHFPRGGNPIIGTEAANMALAAPERTVANWKRSMGTDDVLFRDDNGTEYLAKDILTLFFEKIKKTTMAKLGQDIEECVVCVPANYGAVQKQETKDAAEKAGLSVLQLVSEPTAAALGNGLHKLGACTVLVYDLGGGTFDISILQTQGNITKVLTTNGEAHLGGQDFNNRFRDKVLEMFEQEHGYRPQPEKDPLFFQDMVGRIESAKMALSAKDQTSFVISCSNMLLNRVITRADFESWTSDLIDKSIERTLKTITECGLDKAQIDCLYAVGGASKMPMVSSALERDTSCQPAPALGLVAPEARSQPGDRPRRLSGSRREGAP